MTWGELKKIVENSGVDDDFVVDYIDVGNHNIQVSVCDSDKTFCVH